jgi:hypothetical protein
VKCFRADGIDILRHKARDSANSKTKQAPDLPGHVRTCSATKERDGTKAGSICKICSLTCSFRNSFEFSLEGVVAALSLPSIPLVYVKSQSQQQVLRNEASAFASDMGVCAALW